MPFELRRNEFCKEGGRDDRPTRQNEDLTIPPMAVENFFLKMQIKVFSRMSLNNLFGYSILPCLT